MEILECDNCGNDVKKYPSKIKDNNFCSHDCHTEWRTGENNHYWSGGKVTSECIVCEEKFKHYESQRSGDYCSVKCKSLDERRESYQDTKRFYNRTNWYECRERIKTRDGHECKWCGDDGSGSSLHVHHLHPIELGGAKYESSNLVTLCNRCHRLAHNAIKYPEN